MASATGTGTKPRIRIRDATQADADTIAAIHFDAFGPGVMGRLLNRNQHVVHPETLKGFAKALFAPTEQPPNAKRQLPVENVLMVAELVMEGEGDEIIAFAKWKIVEEQLSEEEWNVEVKDKTQEEVGEWTDVEVHNAFIRALNRQMMGYQRGEACVCEFSPFCLSSLPAIPPPPLLNTSHHRPQHPRLQNDPPPHRRWFRPPPVGRRKGGPRGQSGLPRSLARGLSSLSPVWVRGSRCAGFARYGALGCGQA